MTTGTIIVATDGSDTGQRAVDYAAALSGKFEQPLCIVHVLMHGRPPEEFAKMAEVEGLAKPAIRPGSDATGGLSAAAEDKITENRVISALGDYVTTAAKRRAEDAGAKDVTTLICAGDTADEILDAAETEKAGVIVLGRRGLGRVREVFLGSVSQKVLHQAGCTVIIVQ